MITEVCQRWWKGRASYRCAREPFNPLDHEVALIAEPAAKAFVEEHHYAHSYPAARERIAIYHKRGTLEGVAILSQPAHNAVLRELPGPTKARAELGRLVLLDRVGANAESWFLARAFEIVSKARGIESLVSFSDDVPRTNASGEEVRRGHVGTIYQASNARYIGRGTPRTLRLLPDGTVFSDRSIQKIRARERGWEYAMRTLVRFGATPLTEDEDSRAWLKTWLPQKTRPLRHPGCHKYLIGMTRQTRRIISRREDLPRLPYPKLGDVA